MSRTYDCPVSEACYPDASNKYEALYGREDRHGGNASSCNGCNGRGFWYSEHKELLETCSWCKGSGVVEGK